MCKFGQSKEICEFGQIYLHLYIYYQSDLVLPDNPKAFTFIGSSLLVCIKKDLFHVTVSFLYTSWRNFTD